MTDNEVLHYSDPKYKFCVYHENEMEMSSLFRLTETKKEAIQLRQDMIFNYCNDADNQFFCAEIIRVTYLMTTVAGVSTTINNVHTMRLSK
jgi:hypothetical protein|tara:strand:- start:1830 stop:2102 length:273 start_codon:yes stop_codon:yes gene_type:complete